MRLLARLADRLVEAAAVVLLLSLLAAVVLGVLFRLAGDPLAWSDEAAQYLLVWTGFVGWVIAARRRAHIRIDAVASRLPRPARTALEVAIQLALAGFGVALAIHSLRLIGRNWDVEAVSLPVPSAFLYLPLPFAGGAVALQAACDLVAALTGRRVEAVARPEAIT